ncbi:VOC family protein [Pseudomonas aeruginosa]|uniref:VOC family protein n=1 Tax=Pseudomonas aeruginosa TaxID=287 RepID=UPI000FC3FE24|nr:VOC family protein [Pseudomonas aeruginosa]RUE82538.1 glyoxalase/bleomycin resistance/dioxygenase family protein [Pseudomonas aeruginosa]
MHASGMVLYVADLEKMARFYGQAFDLAISAGDHEHRVLCGEAFELVLLVTPAAQRAQATGQGARRGNCAIKLVFFVADLALLRRRLATLGGSLAPPEQAWSFAGHQVCDAIDPEGNVLQLRMPLRD